MCLYKMKCIKIVIISGLILAGFTSQMSAQDVSFSQTYASPLYLSPSFAGLSDGSRLTLNYRDQWPGIKGAYKSIAFAADHYFSDYKSGLGLLFVRDDQGSGQFVKQDFGLVYAYEIEVMRDIYVRPGIQFKYAEQKIDPTRINAPEDINQETGEHLPGGSSLVARENYKRFDASASAMIYSDFFWGGVTVDHLVKNDVGFTDLETNVPIKTTVFGGYKLRYKEGGRKHDEQSVTLALNYRMQQHFNQLDVGTYWYINPLELGLWYRGIPFASSGGLENNDALIMIFGLTLGDIRFSYSYDLTLSDLAGHSNGANEFGIMYRFNSGYKKKSYRGAMPCSQTGYSGASGGAKYRRKARKIF